MSSTLAGRVSPTSKNRSVETLPPLGPTLPVLPLLLPLLEPLLLPEELPLLLPEELPLLLPEELPLLLPEELPLLLPLLPELLVLPLLLPLPLHMSLFGTHALTVCPVAVLTDVQDADDEHSLPLGQPGAQYVSPPIWAQ